MPFLPLGSSISVVPISGGFFCFARLPGVPFPPRGLFILWYTLGAEDIKKAVREVLKAGPRWQTVTTVWGSSASSSHCLPPPPPALSDYHAKPKARW